MLWSPCTRSEPVPYNLTPLPLSPDPLLPRSWLPVALAKFTELTARHWRAALSNDLFQLYLRVPGALLRQFRTALQSSFITSDALSVLLSSPLVQEFAALEHLQRAIELAGPLSVRGYVNTLAGLSDATLYTAPPALLILTKCFSHGLLPFVATFAGPLEKELSGEGVQEELASAIEKEPHLLKQFWCPNGAYKAAGLQQSTGIPCPLQSCCSP